MITALIDNATLHAAGNLFTRPQNGLVIREINLQSFDSFLEAYILNDKLKVDQRFWQYFVERLPELNKEQFKGVVETTTLDLNPVVGLDEFLESEIVYWLINGFNSAMRKLNFYDDFLSYTGADFGNYANADGDYSESFEFFSKIEKKLTTFWDWKTYHTANTDHIDSVNLAYRTINYILIAESNGYNLISHEIRNFFISSIGNAYGLEVPQKENLKLYSNIVERVKKLNQVNYVQEVIGEVKSKKAIWDVIKTPFLPAIIYERSRGIGEVLLVAEQLRSDFKGYREILKELNTSIQQADYIEADKITSEINSFLISLEQQLSAPTVEWSISAGFPLSLSLGLSKKNAAPKYLRVFKDFLYRFSLPQAYVASSTRLFGSIRWNKSIDV